MTNQSSEGTSTSEEYAFNGSFGMALKELETASRILDDSLAWFAQRGEPLDGHDDIEHQGHINRRDSDVSVGARASLAESVLFGPELLSVVTDLVGKFWQKHFQAGPSLYIDRGVGDIFPIYSNGGRDIDSFVLSRVDNLAGCRIYPTEIPVDEIRLSLAGFGPAANRIRFLSELTSIYSQAVGLTSQSIRFNGRLVASFRNLVGLLRIELRPYSEEQSSSTRSAANNCENSSNIHLHDSTREGDAK
ncbi:hypothetical protein AALI21_02900 [Corynebacteriaceae bacterium 6-324]